MFHPQIKCFSYCEQLVQLNILFAAFQIGHCHPRNA